MRVIPSSPRVTDHRLQRRVERTVLIRWIHHPDPEGVERAIAPLVGSKLAAPAAIHDVSLRTTIDIRMPESEAPWTNSRESDPSETFTGLIARNIIPGEKIDQH